LTIYNIFQLNDLNISRQMMTTGCYVIIKSIGRSKDIKTRENESYYAESFWLSVGMIDGQSNERKTDCNVWQMHKNRSVHLILTMSQHFFFLPYLSLFHHHLSARLTALIDLCQRLKVMHLHLEFEENF